MQKWVQMGYYWVIGFWVGLGYRGRNPKPNGLGFGSEVPTQNGFCRSLVVVYIYIGVPYIGLGSHIYGF